MAKEIGTLVALEGNIAVVHFARRTACGKCRACGLLRDESTMELRAEAYPGARVGDRVELTMSDSFVVLSAALLYGVPFVLLVAGIVAGLLALPALGFRGDPQALAALLGIALAGTGYGVLHVFSRRFAKMRRSRMVLRKAEPGEDGD